MKILLKIVLLILFTNSAIACTIVSCARRGEIFAAANEDDYISTLYSKIWFNPPTKVRYGTVCFGLPDLQLQAAMNEYGLFVDFTMQTGIDPSKLNLKHPYKGDLFYEVLGKCRTVKEALKYLETRDFTASAQALLADAAGNSVIINAGAKVVKNKDYQINTNFNICDLKTGYTCGRYDIAEEMLSKNTPVSVGFFKQLLDRTHQEGNLSTLYSYVFDIKRGLIYVYHFHNFNNVYVIDLKKELKKGYRLENLEDHFPSSFTYQSLVQKDPGNKKEQILAEINKAGLGTTVTRYLTQLKDTAKSDIGFKITLMEVGLQLVKNSWNQNSGGGMWNYWFSLPAGYTITNYKDPRLDAANEIFKVLQADEKLDLKLKNFIKEIDAYVNLTQGNTQEAKALYQSAIADKKDTYPVSYNRATIMLTKI